MSKVLINETNLTNIAEAIRGKTGETAKMKPAEMAGKIEGIQTGSSENMLEKYINGGEIGNIVFSARNLGDSVAIKRTFSISGPNVDEIGNGVFKVSSNGYSTITKVDLPKATAIRSSAFEGCNIKELNVPNVTDVYSYAFKKGYSYNSSYDSLSFEKLYIPKAYYIQSYAFQYNNMLEAEIGTQIKEYDVCLFNSAFEQCERLRKVKMGGNFGSSRGIGSNCFYRTALETLVIVNGTQPVKLVGTSAFQGTPIESGTGSIYVPDALVEQYKVATNWTVYADQIKPLSEYTEA